MKRVVFMAPLSAIQKRTRLAKMATVILQRNLGLSFFGWEREKGELENFKHDHPSVNETAILHGGGYASSKVRLYYPLWMMAVFWKVLKIGRNQKIFALGWETAFPACVAGLLTGAKVVFDDADRFSLIVRLPGPAHRLVQSLERWTSRRAAVHIIPGRSRYEWHHERMIVLRNSPLRAEIEAARQFGAEKSGGDLVLYANGWVGETRGAPIFLKLLELAEAEALPVRMVIAGRVDGPSADRLANHPFVEFVGEVDQAAALALYARCDAVLTFYDPEVPINRKAESNKWGDAVFLRCPIIVNSEVETAQPLIDGGAAWSVSYSDENALLALVRRLISTPSEISDKKSQLEKFESVYPVFDHDLDQILTTLDSEGSE